MTTKELRRKLKVADLPANGNRTELARRFKEFRNETLAGAGMPSSDEGESDEHTAIETTHPAIVTIDYQFGERYMRVVDQHGLGGQGEM